MSALKKVLLVSAPPWGERSSRGPWLEFFGQKSPREIYLHDVLRGVGADLLSPAQGRRTLPVWLDKGDLVVAAGDAAAFVTSEEARREQPNRLYLRPGTCAAETLVLQPPMGERNVAYGALNGVGGGAGPVALTGRLLEDKGIVPLVPGQSGMRLLEREVPQRSPDGWLNPVVTVWELDRRADKEDTWRELSGEARLEVLPLLAPELAGRAGFLAWGAEVLSGRNGSERSAVESVLWGRAENPGRMPKWLAFLALDQMGGSFLVAGHGQAAVVDRPRLTWVPPGDRSALADDVARILASEIGADESSSAHGLPEVPPAALSLGRAQGTGRLGPWAGSAGWWKDRKLDVLLEEHPDCRDRAPFAAVTRLLAWLAERTTMGSSWPAALEALSTSHLGGWIGKLPDGSAGFDCLGYLESFGRRFVAPTSPLRIEIPWPRQGRGPTGMWFDPVASPAFGARLFAERVLTGLLQGIAAGQRRAELGADVWWLPWAERLFTHPADLAIELRERPGFMLGSSKIGVELLGRGSAISVNRSEMRF